MENKDNKRFDEKWEVVDCNDCSHYWTDTCDGVPQGSERPCNSFLATRSVVIPSQIKSLKRGIRTLEMGQWMLSVAIILLTMCIWRLSV